MDTAPKLDQQLDVEKAWLLAHLLSADCRETADRICSAILTMATCYPDLDEALMACHRSISSIDSSRPHDELELELGFIRRRLNELCADWERRKSDASI